jgi:hypothetical protein
MLLKTGDCLSRSSLNTLLCDTAERGNARTVRALLEAGADVHDMNDAALRWTRDKMAALSTSDIHKARCAAVISLLQQWGARDTQKAAIFAPQ